MSISWAESTFAEAIAPAPSRIFRKNPRLLLMFPPSRIGGSKSPPQTQWTLDRTEMHGQAIDITSLLWLPLLEGQGKTQMRRMLKEAADAEGGNRWLLSERHALAGS